MEAFKEIWVECPNCEETITSIESINFDGKCQSCYLGISKQSAQGTAYYTLLAARSIDYKGSKAIEAAMAFPMIGVIELIIGYVPEGGLGVITLNSPVSVMSKVHILNVVEELLERCIDFTEVAEILRVNSVG